MIRSSHWRRVVVDGGGKGGEDGSKEEGDHAVHWVGVTMAFLVVGCLNLQTLNAPPLKASFKRFSTELFIRNTISGFSAFVV